MRRSARPDPVLGERVQAFVTTQDAALDANELRTFCGARLADYKVPEVVSIGTAPLPRNAAGKVLKTALRARIATETA